jgi:hypothetical protein
MSNYTETAEDYLIVTHAVPIERVWTYVPEELELDTVMLPNGTEAALVSVVCLLHRGMKWEDQDSPLDFHQCTYQTCVRRGGEPGVYVFGTFVESGFPSIMRRIGISNACFADFEISISYDDEKRTYNALQCEVLSDEGDTLIEIESDEAVPIDRDAARFVTDRRNAYFTMQDGVLGFARSEFTSMEPSAVKLLDAEFELWEEMEILREEEFLSPYSVLIQPSIEIKGSSPERLD